MIAKVIHPESLDDLFWMVAELGTGGEFEDIESYHRLLYITAFSGHVQARQLVCGALGFDIAGWTVPAGVTVH